MDNLYGNFISPYFFGNLKFYVFKKYNIIANFSCIYLLTDIGYLKQFEFVFFFLFFLHEAEHN